MKILIKLLNAGGDLRLHDNQGRNVKDWAMLQPNPKKRMKMLEFLDKARLYAMSSSGQDLLLKKAPSSQIHKFVKIVCCFLQSHFDFEMVND